MSARSEKDSKEIKTQGKQRLYGNANASPDRESTANLNLMQGYKEVCHMHMVTECEKCSEIVLISQLV